MNKLEPLQLQYAKSLLENSDLSNLQILYLHGEGEMSLLKARDFLPPLLKLTKKQIFLDSFKLWEEDLKMIFMNCINSKNLSLVNCQITNIGNLFKVDKDQEYKIKELDLFWSCVKDDKDYFDQIKLSKFLKLLRHTKLKRAIRRVHVWEEDFPKDCFRKIFEKEDLEYELKVDQNLPRVRH